MDEVAEQLEIRASALPPAGLAGAAIALSQLGPWPSDSCPAAGLFQEILERVHTLNAREASAITVAAATLGYDDTIFWQQVHGALLNLVKDFRPKHMADTLLALATHQRCPITLLEELQTKLSTMYFMEADEALTCAWSLCSMQLFPRGTFGRLVEIAVRSDQWNPSEVNQLSQIALSLELEPSASKIALPAETSRKLEEFQKQATLESATNSSRVEAVVDELRELFKDSIHLEFGVAVKDLYTIDLSISRADCSSGAQCAIILDEGASFSIEEPQNPWLSLKLRHLRRLGWLVEWLPLRRWDSWTEEERQAFVQRLTAAVSK